MTDLPMGDRPPQKMEPPMGTSAVSVASPPAEALRGPDLPFPPDVPEGDRAFMARALELAARGRGGTSPNPMVGALIVNAGVVLGEGWHHRAGGPHAEVAALESCGDVRGSTLYVSLEPCCHTGRTGPCTKAVIAAGIRRVVIALEDPNPLVAGQGAAELRLAGIEVVTGVLEAEARALNRAFVKWIVTRRPWLTLKLAMSLDGRIARRPGEETAVSGPAVWERVQAMRASVDAVMIGSTTARVDSPRLTVRALAAVSNRELLPPWRIVVDSKLTTPLDAPLFSAEPPGAIVATALPADDPRARALSDRGVRVLSLPRAGRVDLALLMEALGSLEPRPVTSVLCEGGGVLAASLIEAGLVDELVMVVAPRLFGANGVPAIGSLEAEPAGLVLDLVERVGDDVVLTLTRSA